VLDVGCGPGHLTEHLRCLDVDAIGIDLVPEFIDHARVAHPNGRYVRGSMNALPATDGSVAGILAWYSLIHVSPNDLDSAFGQRRRALAFGGMLILGFFDYDQLVEFEHKVAHAYLWPAHQLSARLKRAGFIEVERLQRPGVAEAGRRPHGAIAAIAQ
jgi:SAM-dependent methyltransferase